MEPTRRSRRGAAQHELTAAGDLRRPKGAGAKIGRLPPPGVRLRSMRRLLACCSPARAGRSEADGRRAQAPPQQRAGRRRRRNRRRASRRPPTSRPPTSRRHARRSVPGSTLSASTSSSPTRRASQSSISSRRRSRFSRTETARTSSRSSCSASTRLPRRRRRGRFAACSTRNRKRSGPTCGCLRSSSTTITSAAATRCGRVPTWPTSSGAPSRRRTWSA